MKRILIAVLSVALLVMFTGCTTLVSNRALKHELVTLQGQIDLAEQTKQGIVSHATIENMQDSPDVIKTVEGLDKYIAELRQQQKETQAILDARDGD